MHAFPIQMMHPGVSEETDPHWANVVLLMGFEAFPIVDESSYARTVGDSGVLVRSAVEKIDGEYSVYSNNSNDGFTLGNGNDFQLGTGDFTLEYWHYRDSNSGNQTAFKISRVGDVNYFTLFRHASSGQIRFTINTTTIAGLAVAAPDLNVWTHYALTREGTTFRLFFNGTLASSATSSAGLTVVGDVTASVGDLSGAMGAFRGYLDELRVTKGVCRYTGNFTPPTRYPRS